MRFFLEKNRISDFEGAHSNWRTTLETGLAHLDEAVA
jgi:hypothetical protein